MIEFVISASPETNRNEPPDADPSPSRQSVGPGGLRVHESRCFAFPFLEKLLSTFRAAELFGRYPVLRPAFDGEHVTDHLPRYGERCPVGVAFFQLSGTDHRQVW